MGGKNKTSLKSKKVTTKKTQKKQKEEVPDQINLTAKELQELRARALAKRKSNQKDDNNLFYQ